MSEQRLSDSGFEDILWSSKIVATFFKIVAVIVLILGFIAGIINAYDVTHTTVDGQTVGVPGTGGQGFIAFLISFGLAFVSAGVFLFFAFVLELLSASAIRSSIVPLPPISNLQTDMPFWKKADDGESEAARQPPSAYAFWKKADDSESEGDNLKDLYQEGMHWFTHAQWRKSDSNNDGDKVNNQSLCPSCGSELTTGNDFCGDCGARVSEG
jgi:hypothetical protein